MSGRRSYALDVVVAHVADCPECGALLDVSAATRTRAARAAFEWSLGWHLVRPTVTTATAKARRPAGGCPSGQVARIVPENVHSRR